MARQNGRMPRFGMAILSLRMYVKCNQMRCGKHATSFTGNRGGVSACVRGHAVRRAILRMLLQDATFSFSAIGGTDMGEAYPETFRGRGESYL